MCGIIGYTGTQAAAPILLDGLERLEYRGYDSAGVAVSGPDGIQVHKCKGRLRALREQLAALPPLTGSTGVGHTRWATHGEPSDVNAHPHVSADGRIAVVHNGIIENYGEIKAFLQRRGAVFQSDTDTEVVAQLLGYYLQNRDIMDAVYAVLRRIKGAYALGILSADRPGQLIAARKEAPLLIGYGDGEMFIASDVTALLAHTRTVAYMEDGEVAVLTPAGAQVYDCDRCPVEKEKHRVEWDVSAAEKGGWPHFMLKEIMEQPEAVRRTVSAHLKGERVVFEELAARPALLRGVRRVFIVACGSAYHVGMLGKYTLERLLGIPVEACIASEFRYSDPLADESTLVVTVSQSGETLDSMAAQREAKRRGARTVSIVNVIGSSIARESDVALYTLAGPEIAVATTKAYSTQLVLLTMLALYWAAELGTVAAEEYAALVSALRALPAQMEQVLAQVDAYQQAASRCFNHSSVFFIGRNLDYALGLEGSLKLKEISYIHSESYAAGELKHGTISLVEPGTLVVALATHGPLFEKTCSNMVEVQARGADVVALVTEARRGELEGRVQELFVIPETHALLQPNLGVIPLQLFAYYIALHRGCDIDKPRNLAKSVTVE